MGREILIRLLEQATFEELQEIKEYIQDIYDVEGFIVERIEEVQTKKKGGK